MAVMQQGRVYNLYAFDQILYLCSNSKYKGLQCDASFLSANTQYDLHFYLLSKQFPNARLLTITFRLFPKGGLKRPLADCLL